MLKRLLAFCLLALWACNPDKNTLVDPNVVHYQTTQQSMLFFKNMRGMYYDLDDNEATRLQLFRFGDRPQEQTHPVLNVVLVNNWRHDQAYVLLEPNPALQTHLQDSLQVVWQDTLSQQAGRYVFENGNKDTHYRFATQIYNSVLQKHRLGVLTQSGDTIPLLRTEEEREAFRITMMDYYRIVNVF